MKKYLVIILVLMFVAAGRGVLSAAEMDTEESMPGAGQIGNAVIDEDNEYEGEGQLDDYLDEEYSSEEDDWKEGKDFNIITDSNEVGEGVGNMYEDSDESSY